MTWNNELLDTGSHDARHLSLPQENKNNEKIYLQVAKVATCFDNERVVQKTLEIGEF